ncbi:MAG: hypothetical protein AAF772_03500 [Acidobacteriota bacterium]
MALSKENVAQLVDTARAILEERRDIISGCRDIMRTVGRDVDVHVEPFLTIFVFESETEAYPAGDERKLWNQKSLQEKDRMAEPYVNAMRGQIFAACDRILSDFEGDRSNY